MTTSNRPATIAAIRRMNPELFDEVYATTIATADVLSGMGVDRAAYAQALITDAESTLARKRADTNGLGFWDNDYERIDRDNAVTFGSMAAGLFLLGQPNGVN